MSNTLDRCASFDAVIGRPETPYLWQDQVVCGSCHSRLTAESEALGTTAVVPVLSYGSAPTPNVTPPRYPNARGPAVICPNVRCGHSGLGVRKRQGSFLVFLFLFPVRDRACDFL